MPETTKKNLLLVGAIMLIALALIFIVRQVATPHETITRFEDVPPKGAGKSDRQ